MLWNGRRSFEANLEYMWKNFGFYLPDAQYLKDPEGLIKYLVGETTSQGLKGISGPVCYRVQV